MGEPTVMPPLDPDHPIGKQPATQRQLRYLQAVAREARIDVSDLDRYTMRELGAQAHALSRRDTSTLIDLIQTGAVRDWLSAEAEKAVERQLLGASDH